MASMILTAESVENMDDGDLMERYIAAVLAGEEDSDFAVAAKRELIAGRLFSEHDLDGDIDRALDERQREARIERDMERGWNERKEQTENF